MDLNKVYNMDCVDGLKQMVADGNTVDLGRNFFLPIIF